MPQKDFTRAITQASKIIDAWLPQKIKYDRMPGMAVGIVHDGKLVYQNAFGMADVAAGKPMTPETCFRIASISKTFTAVAILQLVEKGSLGLDDKVAKYLPWFRCVNGEMDARHVTIRQLLSHTGGVFRDGDTPHWADGNFPDEKVLRRSITKKTLVFENNTCFKYSNFGFAILGQVIKAVSGMSYEQYVQTHILKKLGMTSTIPDFNESCGDTLAQGYYRPIPGQDRAYFSHVQTKTYAPAAGFISNIPDLAKYLSALSLRTKKHDLVGKELKKDMMHEYWKTDDNDDDAYGLGCDVSIIQKRKIVGHGGGFNGFITHVSLDTENDLGLIVLSNANDSSAYSILCGIYRMIYELVDDPGKYLDGKKILVPQRYEGAYRESWCDSIVVSLGPKLLCFDAETNSPLRGGSLFTPKRKNVFIMETKSNFGSPGEEAQFIIDPRTKKAKTMIQATYPSERLEGV